MKISGKIELLNALVSKYGDIKVIDLKLMMQNKVA